MRNTQVVSKLAATAYNLNKQTSNRVDAYPGPEPSTPATPLFYDGSGEL